MVETNSTRDRPVASDFTNALHENHAVGRLDMGPDGSMGGSMASPYDRPARGASGAPRGSHAGTGRMTSQGGAGDLRGDADTMGVVGDRGDRSLGDRNIGGLGHHGTMGDHGTMSTGLSSRGTMNAGTGGLTDANRGVGDPHPSVIAGAGTPLRSDDALGTTRNVGRADRVVAPRTLDEPPAFVAGGTVMHREPYRPRFSVGATFFGWACATIFSLVFLTLLGVNMGNQAAADGSLGTGDIATVGTAALAGFLASSFLAYLLGGYVAGRMAGTRGALHGGLTVLWAFLATGILVAIGVTAGAESGLFAALPAWLDMGALTTGTILFLVGHVLAMLVGGLLGGKIGERYFGRHFVNGDQAVSRRRTGTQRRGRPL